MNKNIFEKGNINWNSLDILNELDNFVSLYEQRPIKDNKGGMLFAQMFFFYFILKKIKPEFVIESGIYKGQSTWLIENTLQDCEIFAIDIDLSQREYISKKANYSSKDFKFHDFSNISKNSLVFFDDHINHIDRVLESKYFNIKYIVLEDNYPPGKGDFQTLKQIYNNFNFNHKPGLLSLFKTNLIFTGIILQKIFKKNLNVKTKIDQISKRIRDGHEYNFNSVNNLIETYYEFPPLIKPSEDYSNIYELIKDPLLNEIPEKLKKYLEYLSGYNFLTYIKLN